MKIINTKQSLSNLEHDWTVTIGNFDGLHLGHRRIIETCFAAKAEHLSTGIAVMTFDPHPAAVLHPEKSPGLLTPLKYKLHLLDKAGVDCTIVITDSYELLNLSPSDFIDQFLIASVGPKVIVEGSNFNFGYGRSGNMQTMFELGISRGFKVIEVPGVNVNLNNGTCQKCSSTLTRTFLESGRVSDAAKVLGRNYRLMGTVSKGRGIGTQLGFPTANLSPLSQIIPDEGVYAGRVRVGDNLEDVFDDDGLLPAVFSIGRAKTFITDHPILIEAHIIVDDVGDIYGKYMAMDFVKKIRSQQRFPSHEELKTQIAKDKNTAIAILQNA
jgi:riboflavin kinase / FMN adenylyltransferase